MIMSAWWHFLPVNLRLNLHCITSPFFSTSNLIYYLVARNQLHGYPLGSSHLNHQFEIEQLLLTSKEHPYELQKNNELLIKLCLKLNQGSHKKLKFVTLSKSIASTPFPKQKQAILWRIPFIAQILTKTTISQQIIWGNG